MSAVRSVVQPERELAPAADCPAMPVEYETAIKALEACTSLDETRIWRSAYHALAAWAKIYNSRDAEFKAKRLRLHAYRRMGQLARELRPSGRARRGIKGGKLPGSVSLLQEHGLSHSEAVAANFIARLPDEDFQRILRRPLSPISVAHQLWGKDPIWLGFCGAATNLRGHLRRHPPREVLAVARMLGERQQGTLRVLLADLRRMLREFDEHAVNDSRRTHNQS